MSPMLLRLRQTPLAQAVVAACVYKASTTSAQAAGSDQGAAWSFACVVLLARPVLRF